MGPTLGPSSSAYILPKHSRDWSKARPIVSYTQTACAPLSQTVASAIYCLLQIVFPELTALSDVLPLLRRIWKILQQYDPTDDLVLFQQDIAGFFNFVTHPRMVSTVEFLISRYASSPRPGLARRSYSQRSSTSTGTSSTDLSWPLAQDLSGPTILSTFVTYQTWFFTCLSPLTSPWD